jgi:hypothetical protein
MVSVEPDISDLMAEPSVEDVSPAGSATPVDVDVFTDEPNEMEVEVEAAPEVIEPIEAIEADVADVADVAAPIIEASPLDDVFEQPGVGPAATAEEPLDSIFDGPDFESLAPEPTLAPDATAPPSPTPPPAPQAPPPPPAPPAAPPPPPQPHMVKMEAPENASPINQIRDVLKNTGDLPGQRIKPQAPSETFMVSPGTLEVMTEEDDTHALARRSAAAQEEPDLDDLDFGPTDESLDADLSEGVDFDGLDGLDDDE